MLDFAALAELPEDPDAKRVCGLRNTDFRLKNGDFLLNNVDF